MVTTVMSERRMRMGLGEAKTWGGGSTRGFFLSGALYVDLEA